MGGSCNLQHLVWNHTSLEQYLNRCLLMQEPAVPVPDGELLPIIDLTPEEWTEE
jgi:hypothetical protein